jgi:predicted N-formylglutamate amidohydrolase
MNDIWYSAGMAALGNVLIVGDHASNRVPPEIDLGIDQALLETHIGWDIGVAALARALKAPAWLGHVSRLVIDLNRDPGDAALVPLSSDGHDIPGNAGDTSDRIARYWHPYHDGLARHIALTAPAMLVSLHSFTPRLTTRPEEQRPWEVGVLYNCDERAPRLAIPRLEAAGIVTGDQQPYSGKLLNASMNRHAEANDIPYLGLEVRQDLIDTQEGVVRWAARLGPIIAEICASIA